MKSFLEIFPRYQVKLDEESYALDVEVAEGLGDGGVLLLDLHPNELQQAVQVQL